jgi:carboxymethylenebutenolidase
MSQESDKRVSQRMIEEKVRIRTEDGVSDGFLYRPEGARVPGVIHLTDIVGIRPAQCGMARRLAAEGYAVLVPNLFYRTSKVPVFDFTPNWGDERTTKRLGELAGPLTPDAMERDASKYVNFLTALEYVSDGGIGVVGFCFAGAMAMRAAAARPDKIASVASFHGGRLFTDAPTSPHLALSRIGARLYFGHAVKDNSMPADAIAKFDRALEAWGGTYESEVYEGALHSWTVPDSPAYNQPQAERAFEKLEELFAATLG